MRTRRGCAEQHVTSVPFITAEILIEAVGEGVPGHLPAIRAFSRAMSAWEAREAQARAV